MAALTTLDVAKTVGCNMRAACRIMRTAGCYSLTKAGYNESLRIESDDLERWLSSDVGRFCTNPNSHLEQIAPAMASGPLASFAYLVRSGKAVKIGESDNVERRVSDLQKANPVQIELVAALRGGLILESVMHERFSRHRIHGEWFRLRDDLGLFVSRLRLARVAA